MPTPGYAVKHWWRSGGPKQDGMSLKQMARRHSNRNNPNGRSLTTTAKWLERKASHNRNRKKKRRRR